METMGVADGLVRRVVTILSPSQLNAVQRNPDST